LEEYAYVIDYLPQGRSDDKSYRKTPLVLAIGETEFKLLEIIPKENAVITIGDRLYIGKDQQKRDKVLSVKRRISYEDLTSAAQNELPFVLESIVAKREKDFVKFFNEAESINARMHSLELLPGLGNKTMWNIIDERKKRPFTDFNDLTERVKTIHNPQKMIASRIIQELQERYEKHKLFVAR
jgi:Predicted RNA-binding protein